MSNQSSAHEVLAEDGFQEAIKETPKSSITQTMTNFLQQFVDQRDEDAEDTMSKDYLDYLADMDDVNQYTDEFSIEPEYVGEESPQSAESTESVLSLAPEPNRSNLNADDLRSARSSASPNYRTQYLQSNEIVDQSEPTRASRKKKKAAVVTHSDDGSTSNSSFSLESNYFGEEINKRNNFIAQLRDIPDINELTEGSSIHSIVELPEDAKLTNQLRSSTAHRDSTFDDYDAQDYEDESVESESSEITVKIPNFSSLTSLSSKYYGKMTETKEKTAEEFDDIQKKLTEIVVNEKTSQHLRIFEINNQRVEICKLFLQTVIDQVVATAEDKAHRFNRILDKEKLWKNLREIVLQIRSASIKKKLLENAMKDHFLRKKQMYLIKVEQQFDKLNYKRWRKALYQLDRRLQIQNKTREKSRGLSIKLRDELAQKRLNSDQMETNFEQVVRNTLLTKESFTHLSSYIDDSLRRMRAFRDELSEMRLELFQVQHRFANIKNKSDKLEYLGDGLKMQDFVNQQTETVVLNTKIGERNNDLNRLHSRLNFNMHALAHHKCKAYMERTNYSKMKFKLRIKEQKIAEYQELIHQGKLKHNKIHRELYKLRTSGPLIFFPHLMHDYDDTLMYVKAKQATVAKLRSDLFRLTQRITIRESILSKNSQEHLPSSRVSAKAEKSKSASLAVTGQSVL